MSVPFERFGFGGGYDIAERVDRLNDYISGGGQDRWRKDYIRAEVFAADTDPDLGLQRVKIVVQARAASALDLLAVMQECKSLFMGGGTFHPVDDGVVFLPIPYHGTGQ